MQNKLIINLITLFILYFVQGIPFGFQSRYLPIILRLNYGLSLSELGFMKLLLVPWMLKIFISTYLIDNLKLSKKFWLLLSLACLSAWSFVASVFYDNMHLLSFIMFCLNLFSVVQDICVDWFAINILDAKHLGLANTIQVSAFKIGTLFSGGLLVWLIEFISIQRAFQLISCIYFLCFMSLLRFSLLPTSNYTPIDEHGLVVLNRIKALFYKVPQTMWLCVFLVVYKLGEQSSLNMFPLYLIDNKVNTTTIGLWTGIIGQCASISGSFLAGILLKNSRLKTRELLGVVIKLRVMPICTITALILYRNFYHKQMFSFIDLYLSLIIVVIQLFLSGLLTTITFTLMMEVSLNAPTNIQASHYSLLATFEVLGKLLFQPLISIFTDFFGYSYAFCLFSCLYILCIYINNFNKSNNISEHCQKHMQ